MGIILLSACSENAPEAPKQTGADLGSGKYCYGNTTTGNDITDVEELVFTVTGSKVAGEYNWLPQLKDQRKGNFDGTVSGRTIEAIYQFSQEGQSKTVPVTITVGENESTVKGGSPDLGLAATLPKITCP